MLVAWRLLRFSLLEKEVENDSFSSKRRRWRTRELLRREGDGVGFADDETRDGAGLMEYAGKDIQIIKISRVLFWWDSVSNYKFN